MFIGFLIAAAITMSTLTIMAGQTIVGACAP